MVAQLCPSSCLILCTSTILELLPPQHLVDADMECPSSCVHACVEASRVHERSGGSFGQSLKDNFEMISIIASFIAHQIEYDLLMLRWAQGEYNMLINTVEFPQG
ncbi:hypothetical protein JL721_8092 [Aureococcus anophagefferens]|nr:hypothetical protein JL721_8092 [Aureococcus anophagefferens]